MIMSSVSQSISSDFVVMSIEERLVAWRELDQKAVEAEQAVARIGQAAADPRIHELFSNAKYLREKSDREFAAILRAVKHQ